ncbi:phosphopantetheine-binding protein [Streptomyces sp. KHY 26]|uniref:phosphopantetheine-binding protein n=1 Tax=Streptomyces sp. KHY 26 TaxID=3097359 RepID=UPI00376F1E69
MDNPPVASRADLKRLKETLLAHALVTDATAVVGQDVIRGTYLVAYAAVQQELSQLEMRMYLGTRLPDHLVPAIIYMAREIPRTQDGRIDQRSLPRPSLGRGSGRIPATPEERVLCDLYAELLEVPEVGPEDGFFDFGGHSLLANRLVDLVRVSLGRELPLRSVFEAPRVCDLAVLLVKARSAPSSLPSADR